MNKKRFQITKASVTAEAALVFPIFFFVLMVFLCFFQWMLIQAEVQKALFETASFASQYSFFAEEVLEDKNSSTEKKSYGYQGNLLEFSEGILDMALIKMKFDSILDDRISESICVAGNNIGISFLKSEFLQNGNDIDIVAEYKIRIPFPIFEGYSFRVTQCVKTKAFLGKTMQDETEYSGEDEQREKDDDSVVYITETGRVYHTSKKCNYLKLSIRKIIFSGVSKERNDGGAKYIFCDSCCEKNDRYDFVYITAWGTRFHSRLDCSGLKRTIISKKLSEAEEEGYRGCSKCG